MAYWARLLAKTIKTVGTIHDLGTSLSCHYPPKTNPRFDMMIAPDRSRSIRAVGTNSAGEDLSFLREPQQPAADHAAFHGDEVTRGEPDCASRSRHSRDEGPGRRRLANRDLVPSGSLPSHSGDLGGVDYGVRMEPSFCGHPEEGPISPLPSPSPVRCRSQARNCRNHRARCNRIRSRLWASGYGSAETAGNPPATTHVRVPPASP